MSITRTGSFPYFWLAADLGIPYGQVLGVVDVCEKIVAGERTTDDDGALVYDLPSDGHFDCILAAAMAEHARRAAAS